MSPTNHFKNGDLRPWSLAEVYADLGSRQDIARILNVRERRVVRWLEYRPALRCPYPIRRISHVDVYSMQEWRDWYAYFTEKHKDKKWINNTKPHGSGESFWAYFAAHRDE